MTDNGAGHGWCPTTCPAIVEVLVEWVGRSQRIFVQSRSSSETLDSFLAPVGGDVRVICSRLLGMHVFL